MSANQRAANKKVYNETVRLQDEMQDAMTRIDKEITSIEECAIETLEEIKRQEEQLVIIK